VQQRLGREMEGERDDRAGEPVSARGATEVQQRCNRAHSTKISSLIARERRPAGEPVSARGATEVQQRCNRAHSTKISSLIARERRPAGEPVSGLPDVHLPRFKQHAHLNMCVGGMRFSQCSNKARLRRTQGSIRARLKLDKGRCSIKARLRRTNAV
jgi:hypothetical protein